MAASDKRKGSEATLMTWHCQLCHLLLKLVVELAQREMDITDIPAKISGLDLIKKCWNGYESIKVGWLKRWWRPPPMDWTGQR
jgi:hypothetical protein